MLGKEDQLRKRRALRVLKPATNAAWQRKPRDKELRDPDDVFIHAEERRKELAKQHKKR